MAWAFRQEGGGILIFGLLCVLALLTGLVRAEPDLDQHWSRLPQPEARVLWIVGTEQGLLATCADGKVRRWDGSSWSQELPEPAEREPANHIALGPEGSVLVLHRSKGWSRLYGEQGWGLRQAMPEGLIIGVAFDASGTAWAHGNFGYLARLGQDGWQLVPDSPLGSFSESNIREMVFDSEGVGWLRTDGGQLFRLQDGAFQQVDLRGQRARDLSLDSQGRPLVAADSVQRPDEPGTTVLSLPVQMVLPAPHGFWVRQATDLFLAQGDSLLPFPPPSSGAVQRIWGLPGGGLVVADSLGQLFVTRPHFAPPLRDVAADYGLCMPSGRPGVWAADFDGDGLEDLLVRGNTLRARLLRQREHDFEDVTAAWGLELEPHGEDVLLCDLDGNGLPDVVAREGTEDDPEAPKRLRYLRTLPGWFQEAPIQGQPSAVESQGVGRLTCADIDGDGDKDVLVTGGRASLAPEPRVELLENLGHGWLRRAQLPARGPARCGGWVQQVLVDDFDQDGLSDLLCLNAWANGHVLHRGVAPGQWQEATSGSGVDALYAVPWRAWSMRLDDDLLPDLLVRDRDRGLRVYRTRPEGWFEDSTEVWGLRFDASWPTEQAETTLVTDLDSDGHPDLVFADPERALRARLGRAGGGFEHWDVTIPELPAQVLWATDLDLGGDGDRDLVVVRDGSCQLLENLHYDPPGPSPVPREGLVTGALRRLAWASPLIHGTLTLLIGLPLLLVAVRTRVTRAHSALVRLCCVAVVLSALSVTCWHLLDLPPRRWLVWILGAHAIALLLWRAEVWWVERREERDRTDYVLEALLGEGGFGWVFKARGADREVAVKILNPDHLETERQIEEIVEEARLLQRAARSSRGHVVELVEAGACRVVVKGGQPRLSARLVMEYVDGATLKDCLGAGGAFGPSEIAELGFQLAETLEAIHGRGLAHLDIKPENLMLVEPGVLKLIDFGASLALRGEGRSSALVRLTPAYAAPEQRDPQQCTPACDVYSAGMVLWQLLLNKLPGLMPVAGGGAMVVPLGRDELEAQLGSQPPALAALLLDMLSLSAEERPAARELRERFAGLCEGEGGVRSRLAQRVAEARVKNGKEHREVPEEFEQQRARLAVRGLSSGLVATIGFVRWFTSGARGSVIDFCIDLLREQGRGTALSNEQRRELLATLEGPPEEVPEQLVGGELRKTRSFQEVRSLLSQDLPPTQDVPVVGGEE